MIGFIAAGLSILGAAWILVAAIGLLRLPDIYTRIHACTKPATLGVSLLVGALALESGDPGIAARAVLIVLFFLLTAPVAGHRLSRAAYLAGVARCPSTGVDELARGSGPRASGSPADS